MFLDIDALPRPPVDLDPMVYYAYPWAHVLMPGTLFDAPLLWRGSAQGSDGATPIFSPPAPLPADAYGQLNYGLARNANDNIGGGLVDARTFYPLAPDDGRSALFAGDTLSPISLASRTNTYGDDWVAKSLVAQRHKFMLTPFIQPYVTWNLSAQDLVHPVTNASARVGCPHTILLGDTREAQTPEYVWEGPYVGLAPNSNPIELHNGGLSIAAPNWFALSNILPATPTIMVPTWIALDAFVLANYVVFLLNSIPGGGGAGGHRALLEIQGDTKYAPGNPGSFAAGWLCYEVDIGTARAIVAAQAITGYDMTRSSQLRMTLPPCSEGFFVSLTIYNAAGEYEINANASILGDLIMGVGCGAVHRRADTINAPLLTGEPLRARSKH